MDTLWSAGRLMTPNYFMTSIDLTDAYYVVPIAQEHCKYLRFYWQGCLYQYTCMPNGLSSTPRCFTKLLKPVYSTLRQYGHINVGYIDNSYLQGSDTKECLLNISDTQTLFKRFGFVINVEKSCFILAQQITFLGFVLDSVSMTIALTEDKKAKMKANCKALLPKTNNTITELAQLVGTLVSCLPGVQFGKLHYRNLEIEKDMALRKHMGNYEAQLTLSSSAKDELTWWIENVDTAFNKFLYCELLANLMFEIRHRNAPGNIQGLFQDISDIHSYNNRSSVLNNFYTQSSRLSIQVNSFFRIGTKIWNEMPMSLRKLLKTVFKRKIKQTLFEILASEDYYIDLPVIIQKVKLNLFSS